MLDRLLLLLFLYQLEVEVEVEVEVVHHQDLVLKLLYV